jgi:hypothetical protein
MLIERGQYGQWVISDLVNGYLVTRQYYGYTKKEAVREFAHTTR